VGPCRSLTRHPRPAPPRRLPRRLPTDLPYRRRQKRSPRISRG
jgi:hypothetical protein